jgi:hypothetical protein
MRLRRQLVATALAIATTAFAQSEPEILKYAEEGLAQVHAGQLSPLVYYKEVFRRIQLTPSAEYPFKAENLRVIGQRIDIYEAVEAGRITREKADRLIAEQQAGWEQSGQDKQRAAQQQREAQAMEIEMQRQMQAAQADAQRRALALQLLQMNRPAPFQIQPYQMQVPKQTNCTSQWLGGQLVTRCE